MSTLGDATAALLIALQGVSGLRASLDQGGTVSPPEAVIGPPRLAWEAFCTDPTTATFRVALVVANTDHALERLWDLISQVSAAVDSVPDAAVTFAAPGTFASGGSELPAYNMTVEVSLS